MSGDDITRDRQADDERTIRDAVAAGMERHLRRLYGQDRWAPSGIIITPDITTFPEALRRDLAAGVGDDDRRPQ